MSWFWFGFLLCGLVVWLALSWITVRGRREYHRLHPKRAVRDKAWVVGFLIYVVVASTVGWLRRGAVAGPGFDFVLFGTMFFFFSVLGALEWRAHRAGEPTWWRWKWASRPPPPPAPPLPPHADV